MNAWLKQHDIDATPLTPSGDWLSFQVPVSKANGIFEAEFNVYTHDDTGRQTIRTMSYSIPQELQGHLTVVYPTTT